MANEIHRLTIVPRISRGILENYPHLEKKIAEIFKIIKQASIIGAKVIILNGPHNGGKTLILKNIKQEIPNTYYCNFNYEYVQRIMNNGNTQNPKDFLYLKYLGDNNFQSPEENIRIFIFDHLELLYRYYQNTDQDILQSIKALVNQLALYSRNEHIFFLISIPTEILKFSHENSVESSFIKIIPI